MSKPKRKSMLTLSRSGFWWSQGEWTRQPTTFASCSRSFKNLNTLYKAFMATEGECTATVAYRHKGRWFIKFIGENK
jgi:hypothetical protein